MGPSHGSLTPGPGGATAVSLGGHRGGGGGGGADMFIGRQVTVVCPQMPPCHARPPSYTVTVYFLCFPVYLSLPWTLDP